MVLVEKSHEVHYAESYQAISERRNLMTTEDFITELFCRIDDAMKAVAKHPLGLLFPSEIVTLGVLFALKGGGSRAFYRWLERDYRPLFPRLPERTRSVPPVCDALEVDVELFGRAWLVERDRQLWD